MADVSEQQCYNKGCGSKFKLADNSDTSCTYHPGVPYFHDAYKEWTCCHKKSTDFSEFLGIKGCKTGRHDSTKPPTATINPSNNNKGDSLVNSLHKPLPSPDGEKKKKRDEVDYLRLPLVPIKPKISAQLLEQVNAMVTTANVDSSSKKIEIGTSCYNTSCKATYTGEKEGDCHYHPGTAVFHEGLKYWSCCQKKTSDFTKFLDQEGCQTGTHQWFKKEEKVDCRLDWYQTQTHLIVSVFAKNYHPHKSQVCLSPTKMKLRVFFPRGEHVYEHVQNLFSVINVSGSCVTMTPSKIEIKLEKKYGEHWTTIYK